jgi:hypothetical protein
MMFSSSIRRARSFSGSKIPPQRRMALLEIDQLGFNFINHGCVTTP